MSLFYLVNHSDPDMRRYTWIVIGATISIFSAVLLFQSVNGLIHHYILEEASEAVAMIIGFVHVLVWYCVTQFTVLMIAKYHAKPDEPASGDAAYTGLALQSPAPTVSDSGNGATAPLTGAPGSPRSAAHAAHGGASHGGKMAEDAKSMGGLLAHITAFAAIHWFHDVFHLLEEEGIGGVSVVLCCVFFLAMFFVAAKVRTIIIEWDGQKSPDEEVWEHVVRETEDDAMALCTSYLISLTLQVMVEGPEPLHEHHGRQIMGMVGSAMGAMLVMVLLAFFAKAEGHGEEHGHHDNSALPKHRLVEIVQLTSSFTFAWCMLCSSTWSTMALAHHLDWTHIWMEVVEAIAVSLTCVFIIRLLDIVADCKCTGPSVDSVIRDCVLAFGVLIGFTWEHPFDLGVEEIAAGFEGYEEIMQFLFCLVIAAIVLPAYKWYIVPIQFKMLEEKEAEDAH
jgi:hypothetical protein